MSPLWPRLRSARSPRSRAAEPRALGRLDVGAALTSPPARLHVSRVDHQGDRLPDDDDPTWLRWHLDARNAPDAGQPSTGSAVALWHSLSSIPSGAAPAGPRVPGFRSTTPIDDHVASMLDRRTRPEKQGDVMSLWHVLDSAAQSLRTPGNPRGMARLPAWLHPRAEAVLAAVPGLLHDVMVCHRQMCAVLGEPPPAIVGHCPHCATPLRYGGTAEIRCTGCNFEWNALVLLEITT